MRTRAALLAVSFSVLFLHSSLVFAQHGGLDDQAYRSEVLQKVANLLESKYVLADKAKEFADEFRVKCASGAYDSCTAAGDFAARVTGDLIAVTGDKHLSLRVIVPSEVGEKAESPLHHPIRYYHLRLKENAGFYKLEWIEPRIGYVDLRRFYSFGEAREMALAAMTFLANANAIIIDVRENGGGSGDYLSSYFLPYPTQLSSSVSREGGAIEEFWTLGNIGMEPRVDVPLFVLTGPNTFSAAESFAYDLQSRKRATIVGEPTKGGAHSVDLFPIDDTFEFMISTSRAVSPVTGGNWEGTGVIPDVVVSSEAALDTALAEAKRAAGAYGHGNDERLKKAVEKMQIHADKAVRLYREGRDESAGAALDSLFQVAAKAGLLSEFFVDVFAYNFQAPEDEKLLFAILKKNTEVFSDSPSAFERLASIAQSRGDNELALQNYRKVLELDPGNRRAAKMIKALQK